MKSCTALVVATLFAFFALVLPSFAGGAALPPTSTSTGGSASQDSNPNASFADGVEAYRAGDYAASRERFLEALEQRDSSRAATLHNLGNVAFRQKRPLEAAAWYAAALRQAPRRADTWWNLEYVRREAGLEPADRGDLSDTAARLATMLTLGEAERLVLGLLGLLAVVLVWEALRGGVAAKAAAWTLVGLVAVALVPYLVQLQRSRGDALFVVQPEGAALTSEPREGAALIGRLSPASLAERIDRLPGWTRVRIENGDAGWVRDDSVVALSRGS